MADKRSGNTPPEVDRTWTAIAQLEATLKAVDQGRPAPRPARCRLPQRPWQGLVRRARTLLAESRQRPVVVAVVGLLLLIVGLAASQLLHRRFSGPSEVVPMRQDVFDAYWGAQRPGTEAATSKPDEAIEGEPDSVE